MREGNYSFAQQVEAKELRKRKFRLEISRKTLTKGCLLRALGFGNCWPEPGDGRTIRASG